MQRITCARILLVAAAVGLLLGVAGVLLTRIVLWDDDADELAAQFTQVTFTYKDVVAGQYVCSEVTSCECAPAAQNAPSCQSVIDNAGSGPCGGGDCCAAQSCSTCCDTCSEESCSSDGSKGENCESTSITSCSQCGSYSCDCVCTDDVPTQACIATQGSCWAPSKTAVWYDRAGALRSRTYHGQCGYNDAACLTTFLAGWSNGTRVLGYAPRNGATDPLYFQRSMDWDAILDPSGGLITSIVLTSVLLAVSAITIIVLVIKFGVRLFRFQDDLPWLMSLISTDTENDKTTNMKTPLVAP